MESRVMDLLRSSTVMADSSGAMQLALSHFFATVAKARLKLSGNDADTSTGLSQLTAGNVNATQLAQRLQTDYCQLMSQVSQACLY